MNKITVFRNIIVSFINNILYSDLNILSDEQTIQYIIDNNCSISRFGDGEMLIMTNSGSIEFQEYSDELKEKLIKVAESVNSKVLICVPEIISNKHKCKLTKLAIKFWNKHILMFGGYYRKLFSKQILLGDTNISRFYLGVSNRERTNIYIENLRKIWQDRKLLIVEGYNTKLGIGNDLFSNCASINRIICPNTNCFNLYKKIYDSIIRNYKDGQLIICALGPTATVLSYELQNNKGIQCLDLGHIDIEYMWYLKGVNQRVTVEGKNTAECDTTQDSDFENRDDIIDIIR